MSRRISQSILSLLLLSSLLFTGTFSVLADGNVFVDASSSTQWSIVGPNGGDVRSVEIDPRDKNKL
ncbi:MAG: hypothetical protein AAB288_03055, partial [Acidobacteriota bacterium]